MAPAKIRLVATLPRMIRVEWCLNMATGPVVGCTDCPDVDAAWKAISAALREAAGDFWGQQHEVAVRQMSRMCMHESRVALMTSGRWRYTATGIAVVLTEVD